MCRGGLIDDRYVTGRQEDLFVTHYDMCMEFHALLDSNGYPVFRCGPRGAIDEPDLHDYWEPDF